VEGSAAVAWAAVRVAAAAAGSAAAAWAATSSPEVGWEVAAQLWQMWHTQETRESKAASSLVTVFAQKLVHDFVFCLESAAEHCHASPEHSDASALGGPLFLLMLA